MKTRLIEQIADSPKRTRVMFRAAMVILLVAASYNWLIEPQTSYLYAARQNGQMKHKLSKELHRNESLIVGYQKKISELEEQARQSQKVLFQPEAVSDYFFGLEKTAAEAGCRIKSLIVNNVRESSVENHCQDAIVQARQATITAEGDYESFIRFLKQVGQCPQKIVIDNMRFEPITSGKSQLRCHSVLTIYVANKVENNNKTENNHAAAK